jgi:acyl carrier protein
MAISRPEIDGVIEAFVRLQFRVTAGDAAFSRDAHLFEGGYVDSAGVVELLMFVESTFGVKLDDADIFSDEFTTISGLSGLIAGIRIARDDVDSSIRNR